jgi:hypothetical protein
MTGKSFFIFQLVKYRKQMFNTEFHQIMFCIPPESQHQQRNFFEKLREEFKEIELVLGLPKEHHVMDNNLPKLILIGKFLINLLIIHYLEK